MEEVAPVVLNERGAVEEVAPALNGGGRQALLQHTCNHLIDKKR